MKKENIVLIGMPGSGKSTIGVVLAKHLGYRFLDSDLMIQEKSGLLLHQIIRKEGLEGFLSVENQINATIEVTHSVIATGGSVVYGKEAMEHLSQIGTIIYLELPYEGIVERLGDLHKRGVVLRENQSLLELYKERVPLYEKYADKTIHGDGKEIKDLVAEIAGCLGDKKHAEGNI